MAQIAVTILDPRGRRSAQLVETEVPIHDLIPPLVQSLELPESVTYGLLPVGQRAALDAECTLAACGTRAGAELRLVPERNRVLAAILDKLYGEIEDAVKEKAWELAQEKLDALLQLDPDYPDAQGLAEAIAQRRPSRVEMATRGTMQTTRTARGAGGTERRRAQAAPRGDGYDLKPSGSSSASSPPARQGGCLAGLVKGIGTLIVIVVIGVAAVGLLAEDGWTKLGEQVTALLSPNQVNLGTGDVQVTLRWNGSADLDLHVTDPDGAEIWFGAPSAASGGTLDVDANAGCEEQMLRPVENIFWPDGAAPHGAYRVSVVFYQDCDGSGTADYEVTIKTDRQVLDVISGRITGAAATQDLGTFAY